MKNNFSKSYRFISILIIILGLCSIIFLMIVNPFVLQAISQDNTLHPLTLERINTCQYSSIFIGVFLILIGIISFRFDLFRILKSDKKVSFFMGLLTLLWIILTIEILLRILPLDNTNKILEKSVAYEPSDFSVHQLARRNQDVKWFRDTWGLKKDSIKYIIRNGYRGEPFPVIKDKEEIRIFILGGSFVFDIGVGYKQDWPNRVEQILKRKGLKNINIINAGVSGHRTHDGVGRLLSEIHLFDPDYVILCNSWNDIKYFHDLSPTNSLLKSYRSNRHTVYSTHFLLKPIINLLEVSQMYLRLRTIFEKKNLYYVFEGDIISGELKKSYNKWGIKQFQLNIESFVDLCNNIGTEPILFTQPRLIKENNTKETRKKIRLEYTNLDFGALCKAFNECDSTIISVAQKKQTKFFDLAKPFLGKNDLFLDHIHLTNLGSAKIANAVADFIYQLVKEK